MVVDGNQTIVISTGLHDDSRPTWILPRIVDLCSGENVGRVVPKRWLSKQARSDRFSLVPLPTRKQGASTAQHVGIRSKQRSVKEIADRFHG
jgi:hypothetical protein